ncbi:hypothetical protein DACRYDRAFT_112452 [Dacryopinax primogenitus]|uniref:Uncharacterized protein n=1 Tax=Dacryopinax primogenitus (strain DJM 731) TaxID=1858805 RepID=M5FZA5_DACPD|nr:uncharacterized protein DACRYDRAFT_112452 [Dacryopinax primogenitus]EJT96837.1 hypothetical protein DACRYDRAFT_112452 [Dacryopinax primogenitus]
MSEGGNSEPPEVRQKAVVSLERRAGNPPSNDGKNDSIVPGDAHTVATTAGSPCSSLHHSAGSSSGSLKPANEAPTPVPVSPTYAGPIQHKPAMEGFSRDTPTLELDRQLETLRWMKSKDAWFALQLSESAEIYERSPLTCTNVLIRNFAYAQEDRREFRELRMRDLTVPAHKNLDIRISVGIDNLQIFWWDMTPRWQTFFNSVAKLPLSSWQQVAPPEVANEYRWLALAYEWIDLQLEALDDLVITSRETETAPPPEVIAQSTTSATLGPGLRGIDETSETRTREYIRRATRRGQTPLRTQRTAEKGVIGQDGHVTVHGSLSSVGTYRTNLATLAAISFFGASVAWSAVFSGTRGDVVLLAWTSSMFVCGSIAAGSIAIILGADSIDLDRDMNARRALRVFVLTSAVFSFGGIVLLAVTMALIDPDSNTGNSSSTPTAPYRISGMRASGVFTIIASLVEIGVALALRQAFTPGRYKW